MLLMGLFHAHPNIMPQLMVPEVRRANYCCAFVCLLRALHADVVSYTARLIAGMISQG